MFPSRCTQLPCTNTAVAGVRAARGGPANRAAGITPQRRKYARCTASSSSPVPWAGFSPEAGPNRKTRQHTATRVWVTGADGSRTARTSEGLQLRTMVTEHDATGRNHADRLAAVDGRAAGTRQAVGLRP